MVPVRVVDAFASRPFSGNPAAVVLLESPADEAWMQDVAREMNLSETAFVHPRGEAFGLRWFTPMKEVDLCGHATLAAAHVLFEEGRAAGEAVAFETLSGTLGVRREPARLVLDFPAERAVRVPVTPALVAAVGAPIAVAAAARVDLLAEVADEGTLRRLRPDLAAVARLDPRGLIVTAPAQSPGVDYVVRYFAPSYGIDEDPATGSIQCALGPYWSARLGKEALVARQLSARGGTLHVRPCGDRVEIGGEAVTVWRGGLLHAP